MKKYEYKKIFICISAILVLVVGCIWLFSKVYSVPSATPLVLEDFKAPDMEPYGEEDNYFHLYKDYILDGNIIYKAGYYESVKPIEGSDFSIFIPIDPKTFERLPSDKFSDGTNIEFEGRDYEIHVKNNQYTATEKE